MTRFFLLVPLCGLLCFGCREHPTPISGAAASSEVASSPKFPAAVESIVRGYAAECTRIGGTMTGPVLPMTQTVDLDADGRPDYIFNPQNLQCSESASLFCPNGGCELSIALSGDGYQKPITLLGGQPVVTDGPGGKSLQVLVQSFNCKGASRADTCVSIYTWQNGKMDQQYRIQ